MEIKKCPCGGQPKQFQILDNGQGHKWANAYPDCCSEWSIEFRTKYKPFDSEDCQKLAIAAWNSAPRATEQTKSLKS